MSNPSFSNIDLWLFELAEGNLSPEQVEQLELFLLNHPELDVDRDMWEMAKVDKTPIAYPDVASLEKKRRPVAAFAFSGLLLFLVGTGAFIAWNTTSDGFSESDLQAQNRQVKSLLMEQVKDLQNRTNQTNTLETFAQDVAFGKLSLAELTELPKGNAEGQRSGAITTTNETTSGTEIASRMPNSSENGRSADFTDVNTLGVTHNASRSNGNDAILLQSSRNGTAGIRYAAEGVTNSDNLSYVNESTLQEMNSSATSLEVSDELADTDEVGEKNFYVQEPSELEIYEGREWNERKSTWAGPTYSSSTSSRRSIKDRFNKFTRSLERMMNSPIALQNSRDPHFHVPGKTANDINFSSAGTLIATRVQTMSRLQWQGQENEQLMNQISADGYSYGMRGGWGVQLNHQWYEDGGIQVAQAAFTYSPKISVSNWFSIEPSVRVKMGNKRLNSELMQNTDVVEIDRGNAREFYANGAAPIGRSLWYKDVGLGLLVNTKWFFAGVQGDNLFKHKDNLYSTNWSDPRRAESHFTATIGSDWISRNEKLSLSPYIVYQKNEQLSEVWAGANFAFKAFNIGVAASNNLEPAASIGMKFDHFSMHYNADYTTSVMLDKKALSHQLTIRFVANSSSVNKRLFKR